MKPLFLGKYHIK